MMTTDKAQEAIARAKKADPGNAFVASCEKFYRERGHLSDKQIASLAKVTRTRRPGLDLAGPPGSWSASGGDDYGLSNSWDWAGGD